MNVMDLSVPPVVLADASLSTDRPVTITLGLDGSGRVDIVAGGYEDWVRQRFETHLSAAKTGGGTRQAPKGEGKPQSEPPSSGRKLSYKDQRDYDRLPGEIERLEAEIASDEAVL